MKTKQSFEADDGTPFDTREECEAYEQKGVYAKLAHLTPEAIEDAVAYRNKDLARVLEGLGRKCATARIAAGDVSPRGRKPKGAAGDTAVGETAPEAEAESADVTPITKGRKKAA